MELPGKMVAEGWKSCSGIRAQSALNTKLVTISVGDGSEILPAFYSDNYISLLPGEARTVTVDMPGVNTKQALRLKIRGWNVEPASANAGS
jgi:hypothetical protein